VVAQVNENLISITTLRPIGDLAGLHDHVRRPNESREGGVRSREDTLIIREVISLVIVPVRMDQGCDGGLFLHTGSLVRGVRAEGREPVHRSNNCKHEQVHTL
jgi:hypothetical protein